MPERECKADEENWDINHDLHYGNIAPRVELRHECRRRMCKQETEEGKKVEGVKRIDKWIALGPGCR